MGVIWQVLTRKKELFPIDLHETQLARVLNTFDLTALGVGSTLGVGVYVLAGHVAKDTAGPAVILSFLLAAIASVFAGLCYAEFGARFPKAGSAYIYSYVSVGELIAFVIGWNLILEYVIGSASVARGLSSYLDTLLNNTLNKTFTEIAPIDVPYMSSYFDFFSFGISILLAVALAFGMKESSWVNNIVTLINLAVVIFVIVAGSIKANINNWEFDPTNHTTNTTHYGNGGFFPFGVEGMIKGAATCFYGFVGFDCIATTAEEVKNPKRAVPLSIVLSLLVIFLAYFGTSTVITLMVPYYAQDSNAPIPHAFDSVGWIVPKWIVAIGGIFGLCASLFGAMFPLPRIIYAMANDGVIFRFLGIISDRFKTPVIGTLLAGLLTGLMSALFELSQLVKMMSIGTLLAYTLVATSVLFLRYEDDGSFQRTVYTSISDQGHRSIHDEGVASSEDSLDEAVRNRDTVGSSQTYLLKERVTCCAVWKQIFNCGRSRFPTELTSTIVIINVIIYSACCVFLGLSAIYLKDPVVDGEIWAIAIVAVIIFLMVLVLMSIATQPMSSEELSFKVPLVPIVPALSILINIYLMLMLDAATWIRFAVWMAIGVPMYIISAMVLKSARNRSISVKAKANGNGHINRGFAEDNFVANQPKAMAVSDDSPSKESIKDPEKLVLKQFDEILNDYSSEFDDSFHNSDPNTSPNHAFSAVAIVHNELSASCDVQNSSTCGNQSNSEKRFCAEPANKKDDSSVVLPIENDALSENAKNDSFVEPTNSDIVVTNESDAPSKNASIEDLSEISTATLGNESPNFDANLTSNPSMSNFLNLSDENEETSKSTDADVKKLKHVNRDELSSVEESDKNNMVTINNETSSSHSDKITPKAEIMLQPSNEITPELELSDEIRRAASIQIMPEAEILQQPPEEAKGNEVNLPEIEEGRENDKEKDKEEISIPPPPPFVDLGLASSTSDEKLTITKTALNSIKLKPVVRIPIRTEDNEIYSPKSAYTDDEDNLKFGSDKFELFRKDLNQRLKKTPSLIKTPVRRNTPIRQRVNGEPVEEGDVVEEHIDVNKAKDSIASVLETMPRDSFMIKKSESDENISDDTTAKIQPKTSTEDDDEFRKAQKANMNEVFKSIRLRSPATFDSDQMSEIRPEDDQASNNKTEEIQKSSSSEEVQKPESSESNLVSPRRKTWMDNRPNHEAMESIFRSIKLRKKESFREEDASGKPNLVNGPEGENASKGF